MELPVELLDSLKDAKGFDREAFEKVHRSGEQVISIRTNPSKWLKSPPANNHFPLTAKVPWSQFGFYLAERPSFTFDPLFHAGCYYVQEASSMFIEQIIIQLLDLSKPLRVLDLCAAPGGKSTHLQSLIPKESLLVSNDMIRSRALVLKDNMIKWGGGNVMVTQNDPADFTGMDDFFDMIVIDAPCSGSGLFRRDPDTVAEWSENNVHLCSLRQQRILSNILPALKKDGILVYATCSYSPEEDEYMVKWMQENYSLEQCPLDIETTWGIVASGNGYRFWPDKLKGEGFFLAVMRKKNGKQESSFKIKKKLQPLSRKEMGALKNWVRTEDLFCFRNNNNTVYVWPEALVPALSFLLGNLRVIYSGIVAGELIREKLVPAHALAMSLVLSSDVLKMELDRDQAIRYLQRKDLQFPTEERGWQLVCFNGHALGWVNILANRVNNYYPGELRIIKDQLEG